MPVPRPAGSCRSARRAIVSAAALLGLACHLWPVAALGAVSWASGQLTITAGKAGKAPVLLRGMEYHALDQSGPVFRTLGATDRGQGLYAFDLQGPGAQDAMVTVRCTPIADGLALDWTIRYTGPRRQWNTWTSGFSLNFGREVTGAISKPVTRWVKPTGRRPWEVAGDTVYPDTECQLREVLFGDWALVIVAPDYNADWIYGNDPGRAGAWAQSLPAESPAELQVHMALLVARADDLDPACLAARAAGRPLALTLSTPHTANLFAPGEAVPLSCTVTNVTNHPQAGRIALSVHDYQGRALLSEQVQLAMPPGGRTHLRRSIRPVSRGVLFADASLAWVGGRQLARTTIGVLPERRTVSTRPGSPFGLAGLIANPEVYPDQPPLDTVLGLVERIGVRWLRGGFVTVKGEFTAEDEQRVRDRVAMLKRHGILPHLQLGITMPQPEEQADFVKRLTATLERYGWVSDYVEAGNELNYSGTGPEYVDRVLRPVNGIMRRVCPDRRIVTMGLGGVMPEWLNGFVAAGGVELADVVSIHPGAHPKAPEFWEGWRGWVFRSQVQDALAAARQHGGKDVWITEAYAPTSPDRTQVDLRTSADYLVRTYVCAIALGVKVTEWYQFQDGMWFAARPNPTDIEHNFGLIYSDLAPKPAYVAYGAMTEQLGGAAYLGRLDLGADDLYGARFVRDGKPLDVLWSYREKHETDLPWWPPERYEKDSRKPGEPWVERWQAPATVSLPAARVVEVRDLMGNRRTLRPVSQKVTLALTGSPLYVRGLGDLPLRKTFWEELP
jgi:hypothetical protein